jgi:hypothetical protein
MAVQRDSRLLVFPLIALVAQRSKVEGTGVVRFIAPRVPADRKKPFQSWRAPQSRKNSGASYVLRERRGKNAADVHPPVM